MQSKKVAQALTTNYLFNKESRTVFCTCCIVHICIYAFYIHNWFGTMFGSLVFVQISFICVCVRVCGYMCVLRILHIFCFGHFSLVDVVVIAAAIVVNTQSIWMVWVSKANWKWKLHSPTHTQSIFTSFMSNKFSICQTYVVLRWTTTIRIVNLI